jgi:tryptophan synthase alpha chain
VNRGEEAIRAIFGDGPVLLPFLTAGLPDPGSSPRLFSAMASAGAAAFEAGIPYSDPLMDGPVVMRASEMALAAGTTPPVALEVIREVVAGTGRPVLAMTYANPVMQLGWDRFCERLAGSGAAGMIVPDLPLEESKDLQRACRTAGLGLVQFVSPMSPVERIKQVAASDPIFIYGVTDLGVTGERAVVSPRVESLSERVRQVTDCPLVLGVGISTPAQARAVRHLADGVIVGSALVRLVLEAKDAAQAADALGQAVRDLVAALAA